VQLRLRLYLEDSAETVWANHAEFASCRRKSTVALESVRLNLRIYSNRIGYQDGTFAVQSGSRNARDNYSQDGREHHNRQELDQHETTFAIHFSNSSELKIARSNPMCGQESHGLSLPSC
jgi:hypothetical protein